MCELKQAIKEVWSPTHCMYDITPLYVPCRGGRYQLVYLKIRFTTWRNVLHWLRFFAIHLQSSVLPALLQIYCLLHIVILLVLIYCVTIELTGVSSVLQIAAASAQNLTLLDLGMAISFSTILIPALLGAEGDLSFTKEQASWFGRSSTINNRNIMIPALLRADRDLPFTKEQAS